MYLLIHDASKRPAAQRIADACVKFAAKFGTAPSRVLVNPADAGCPTPPGVVVEVCGPGDILVPVNCYAVGEVPVVAGRER